MRCSKLFINTQKSVGNVESTPHRLLLRGNYVHQVKSGFYGFLPLGERIVQNISSVVRAEMNAVGALETDMPILQPAELWMRTGRWSVYGDEMYKLISRDRQEFCLGPTHEEVFTDLVRAHLQSYRQLPFILYQIGKKFRDEARPRFGLVRTREFLMKDAYSFHADEASLDETYAKIVVAYKKIFERLSLRYLMVEASTGEIGGRYSEEFYSFSDFGEERLLTTADGKTRKLGDAEAQNAENSIGGLEIGHAFKLGTTYSEKLGLTFLDSAGIRKHAQMGCYGIGITRLVSAVVDQHNEGEEIVWPHSVAPFRVLVLPLYDDGEVIPRVSEEVYARLLEKGVDALIDDRELRAGAKFADAGLFGIPLRIIIGKKYHDSGLLELENKLDKEKRQLTINDVLEEICRKL